MAPPRPPLMLELVIEVLLHLRPSAVLRRRRPSSAFGAARSWMEKTQQRPWNGVALEHLWLRKEKGHHGCGCGRRRLRLYGRNERSAMWVRWLIKEIKGCQGRSLSVRGWENHGSKESEKWENHGSRKVKSIPNFIFRSGEETRVSRLVSVYMFRRRISLYGLL
jgi:hypothetical protein